MESKDARSQGKESQGSDSKTHHLFFFFFWKKKDTEETQVFDALGLDSCFLLSSPVGRIKDEKKSWLDFSMYLSSTLVG